MSLFRKCLALTAFLAVLIAGTCIYFTNQADTPEVESDEASASNAVYVVPLHDDTEQFLAAKQQSDEDRWWAQAAVNEWNAAVGRNWIAAKAYIESHQPRAAHAHGRSPTIVSAPGYVGDVPCGGSYPPCCIVARESHGNRHAENPNSTASGPHQMLIGTSNNVARAMGRPDLVGVPAGQWSAADQDEGARVLWAGGKGGSNWLLNGHACWN